MFYSQCLCIFPTFLLLCYSLLLLSFRPIHQGPFSFYLKYVLWNGFYWMSFEDELSQFLFTWKCLCFTVTYEGCFCWIEQFSLAGVFSTWKILFLYLLVSVIAIEKSAVSLNTFFSGCFDSFLCFQLSAVAL